MEGPFIGLWALNTRWLTSTVQLGPRAEFDDGCLDLVIVRNAGRIALLLTFLDLESGQHADASCVEYIKVEELELFPLPRTEADPGMVAIDGELVDFATTRVSVLPSKLTLLGGRVREDDDSGGPPRKRQCAGPSSASAASVTLEPVSPPKR
jgi:sphingosine kinase